jgi:hypothetical protein
LDITIEIETQDKFLANELLGTNQTQHGMQIELPSGAVLQYNKTAFRKAAGLPEVVSLTLRFGEDVATSLVAAWLYDKLKDRASKLKMAEKSVEIEKKAIERVLRGGADIKLSANVVSHVVRAAPKQGEEERDDALKK